MVRLRLCVCVQRAVGLGKVLGLLASAKGRNGRRNADRVGGEGEKGGFALGYMSASMYVCSMYIFLTLDLEPQEPQEPQEPHHPAQRGRSTEEVEHSIAIRGKSSPARQ